MSRAAALLAAVALLAPGVAPAYAAGAAGASPAHSRSAPTTTAAHTTTSDLVTPPSMDAPPPGRHLSGERALATARRLPDVRAAIARHRPVTHAVYEKGLDQWQVSWFDRAQKEVAQVLISDESGAVLEHWTGYKVAWSMARGYPGAFGRHAAALYVWIPLCLLFALPFVDPRRPWRLLHLDLLVLLSFSISLAFFSHGIIGASTPLVYPPLLYLLARMLLLARARARGRAPREPLRLLVPRSWLVVAIAFLVAFRVALDVADSNVIDVGYAGVIGAHRIIHGERLYGDFPSDNQHGDTYGPAAYLAYVPFVALFGWGGSWDDLPAAHAAAICFDLLTLLALWQLGRRIRGPTLGVALAYAWASYPFTLFVEASNANDSLLALLVVLALLAARSPWRRGALGALAGMTKFAPFALAPLLATYRAGPRARAGLGPRTLAPFAAALVLAAAVVFVPALVNGGSPAGFWHATLGFQHGRESPFSPYGLYGWPGWIQLAVQAAAVALALALAFVPRRRDIVSLAALAAAVLVAVQLGLGYWFYLYIAWFFPLVMLALLGSFREPRPAPR